VTTPREEQAREEQPPEDRATTVPTVSTAPARSRWSWSRVPSHVGPARTSTIVLAVLFVLLLVLHGYLQAHAQNGYTTVTTDTGQRVRVRTADLSGTPPAPATQTATTTAPTATTTPRSTTPARTSSTAPTATTTTPPRTVVPSATDTSAPAPSSTGGLTSVPSLPATGSPSG
jgi:hypothetical protein